MFRRKLANTHAVAVSEHDADPTTTPAPSPGKMEEGVVPKPEQSTKVPPSPTGRTFASRVNRAGSSKASATEPPSPLLRTFTWTRSTGSILRLATEGSTINVLRMSLFEMHDRMRYRWVLHPQSPLKTLWDLISALAVVYYSWIIPFMLCFDWYEPSARTKVFMKVLDAWGALDILLRFRTGIIECGAVVMNPTVIRNTYVRSIWFPIDIASTFPFEYFIKDDATSISTRKTIKMIKYIKLPRLLRLGRFFKYLKRYKRYSGLTIVLNIVVFTAHVAGCIWVAILRPCANPVEAAHQHCVSGSELTIYWVAFHHGMVSLLGVSATHVENSERFLSGGFGYSPSDDLNSMVFIWSSTVSVIGNIIQAVLFGTIINLVQSWNRAENAFRKKMDHVTHEMEALSLPKSLRARVTAYYDYLWLNNRALSEQLNLLHDPGMSMALRRQIAIYLFKDNLQKIPFFQLATDAVLGMICMQLHQVIYMPDDFIINEGEIGKELFMIVKGIVRVLPPKKCKKPESETIILLGEGDFFGEIGVVMEVERTRSVKAECMAELCVLAREGFDKILVEFPEFATAMKKLIIKRVGEMWKDDGPERMERMTAIADAKMKRSIQAYKNLERLRNKTRALTQFRPRLSSLLTPPPPGGIESPGDPQWEVTSPALPKATNLADVAAAAAIVPDHNIAAPSTIVDSKSSLVSITEDGGDDYKNGEFDPIPKGTRSALDLESFSFADSDGTPGQEAKGPPLRRQLPIMIPMDSSSPMQLKHLEEQLRLVEHKLEARMTHLDQKLEQILSHLNPVKSSRLS